MTKAFLDRHGAMFVDIADQPDSRYLMLVDLPWGQALLSVDEVAFAEHRVSGWSRNGDLVCAVSSHIPVAVVNRSRMVLMTQAERIQLQHEDTEAELKLRSTLDPEAGEVAAGVKELHVQQVRDAVRRARGGDRPFPDGAYR